MKNVCLLVTAFAAAACFAQPLQEEQGALLKNLRLTKFATRAGDRLIVDVPAGTNRSAHGSIPFDIARYDGKGVCATIRARGWRLTPTREKWLGFKFMMPFENARTGTKVYPGSPQIVGDFDWRTLTVCDNDGLSPRTKGSLTLGIQEGTGRVEFDLSSLRIREVGPLWPVTNQNLRCAYTDRVRKMPVRRGVMLGHGLKEKDFADLEAWGVTLARFQMTRQWNTVGGNRDLADYDRYIDGCLDDLENHLVWAKRHGIMIVVDLHAAPGSRDERHDEYMFHDPVYAEHFIKTWRRIATRFRGRPEIFGFDLINEPQQTVEAAPGCDYWTLQLRAAQAIRAIDPETPVIIESNMYDPPSTFTYMMPMDLTNIIYQSHMYVPSDYTHQGVHDRKGPVVSYPNAKAGYDAAYLRRQLQPVRDFQLRHGARIYLGEFSAIVWAPGAGDYIRDCIALFEEYGWDWTFHAFREWNGWSVEHEATPETRTPVPSADNPRKRALLDGFRSPPCRHGAVRLW